MVVHDLRNPADSIQEGLKQADTIMEAAFNEIFEMTNAYLTEQLHEDMVSSEETNTNIRRRMLLAKFK